MKNTFILLVFTIILGGIAAGQVTVQAPQNGANISSPVRVSASATGSNPSYPITAMRVYVDDRAVYTVNASSLNTSLPLTDGAHALVIVAWDASGQAYSQTLRVTVGSAAAQAGVIINSPADGSTVSSPVRFLASATSSNSAYPITAMRVYVDDKSVYLVNASRLDTTIPLASGPHRVVVVAWDSQGFSYTQRASITAGSTTTVGKVSIVSPVNGSTLPSPVSFVASATASAGKAITAMRIYVDNVSAYTVAAGSLNTSLKLASGTRNLIVQAWDNTGAVYKASSTITVAGTPDPPIAHSATLQWMASTSTGVVGYHIYRGAQSAGPYVRLTLTPTVTTNYTDSAVVSGTSYAYVVTAVDGAGRESGYSEQALATIP
jgi:hypothetical protein